MNWYEKTPLLRAVDGGFCDVVNLLVDRGASLHKVDWVRTASVIELSDGVLT